MPYQTRDVKDLMCCALVPEEHLAKDEKDSAYQAEYQRGVCPIFILHLYLLSS